MTLVGLLIPGDRRCAPVGLVSPGVELCGLMNYRCIYARMFFVSVCSVFLSCYMNADECTLGGPAGEKSLVEP